jgi:hypothetical protein
MRVHCWLGKRERESFSNDDEYKENKIKELVYVCEYFCTILINLRVYI